MPVYFSTFCGFLAFVSVSYLSFGTGRDVLLVHRPRSRHTATFSPIESPHRLVELELDSLLRSVDFSISSAERLADAFYLYRNVSTESIDSLTRALARSILVFGAYRVLQLAECVEDILVEKGQKIHVSITAKPWLTKVERLTFLDRCGTSSQKNVADDKDVILFGLDDKTYVLCSCISRGLSRSRDNNHVLPDVNARRRPTSGILESFALKNLPFKVPTAMEPELGLLMCNLAMCKEGSKVLDPFCGSCSLLLAAAVLGAREHEMVGIDANPATLNLQGIQANFAHLGRPPPHTIIHSLAHEVSFETKFDCIVTDPPYDMKEISRGDKPIIPTLLDLASKYLSPGGRCVFFWPHRIAPDRMTKTCSDYYDPEIVVHSIFTPCISSFHDLELESTTRQIMSPTFSRWLCVVRKKKN